MKALINTYPIAFDCPGGGEVQLMKTYQSLKAKGLSVELYDQWNPRIEQFDLVHFFSVFGGSSVFCGYVKNEKKRPVVISPILWPKGDTSGYPMGEIRHNLHLCDRIFPNSHAEAELLAGVFELPLEKFHVVHNGIDPIFMASEQPAPSVFRKHFGIDEPFLLCVGNVEARKNQIQLARASRKLRYRTLLIGNVRSDQYLQEALREGGGFVSYLGHLDHHADLLRSAYRACDAFVLPSTLETPGLAALEAAAMGARVVVTKEGSTAEYFGSEVFYVDPNSYEDIASKIEKALSKPVSQALRKHIFQFTWERCAQETLDGYHKVIGQSRL